MRQQDDASLTSEILDLGAILDSIAPVAGVVADNGGDELRRASLIKYKINWNVPGVGIVSFPNPIAPHDQRPPDFVDGEALETIPLSVGSVVFGVVANGSIVWWAAHERPAMAKCGSAPRGGGGSKKIRVDAQGRIMPDDGGGGNQSPGSPGGAGNPANEGGVPP